MPKTKQFVAQLSEPELRAEAERLLREGRMPSLEELSAAVLETRKKFAVKIRRARREHAERTTIN